MKHRGRQPGRDAFCHAYAVILAGGSGTRFWPLSRQKHPKQLLKLFGDGTLLEQTAQRVRDLIPPERTYVFTSERLRQDVTRALPGVPADQVVAEPAARNTAPCIGLAAHEVLQRDPEGIMVVLPSDHVIRKPAAFRRALRAACQVAFAEGVSVILGVKPTSPHTGYGYVRLGRPERRVHGVDVYRVERFTEKPAYPLARRYVASGRYLWNGGMFLWRASTLLENLRRFQPAMARCLGRIARAGGIRAGDVLARLYPRLEKISIDYALMERVPNLLAVAADIGWSDVGSWSAAYELNPKDRDGNVRPARSLCVQSQDNMIVAPGKAVVTLGVSGLVIVDTPDALLVCDRERAQEVGKAVEEMQRLGWHDVL